jgi:predicted esterase
MNRRQFVAVISTFALACRGGAERLPADGRLAARPRPGVKTRASGSASLHLDGERDAILQMPPAIPAGPMPLLVFLHGATQDGAGMLRRIGPAAGELGVAVLAPDSRGSTWDGIGGGFGPDVAFLNRALEHVFDRVAVDPARLAIGGFSDGATYALSLGMINGDLFGRVLACSPGFYVDGEPHGKPRIFISHGTSDQILPIDQCSRVIVPRLQKRGYDVTFREFAGGHTVPPEIAREALQWVAAAGG